MGNRDFIIRGLEVVDSNKVRYPSTELEKVQIVPSIRDRASLNFFHLPLIRLSLSFGLILEPIQ